MWTATKFRKKEVEVINETRILLQDYLVKLLSYPEGEGWVPHFQVLKSLGDKHEIRTMTEIDKQLFSTLEAANQVAGKLAEAWVDHQ